MANFYLGIVLLFLLIGFNKSQKTYPSKVTYRAKMLYEMKLDMEPTSVRLLLDPRNSNLMSPLFDMVYMSSQPRSEIRRIPDVTARVNRPELMGGQIIVTDQTTIKTPNSVGVLPPNSIDSQPPYVWWIATGLFEIGSGLSSNEGGIYLVDKSAASWEPQPIFLQSGSGFTHAEWTDMNLDGKSDCITIRGSSNRASLIWLAQPRSGSDQWSANFISNSTVDVGGTDFKTMEIMLSKGKGKRTMVIIAGRRTATLSGYWIDDIDNDWTQTSKIRYLEIARGEAYVNVEVVDLNGDGHKDILTSVAAFGGKPGRLLAFEAPKKGLSTGIWRKRILHEWIPTFVSYRTLTPGPSYPFFITSIYKQAEYKPHIIVSGADDGKVYVLSPESWSPFIWTYSMETVYSGNTPIGVPAILDVEGDGNPEIFIPTGESIFVMRYQPSGAAPTRFSIFFLSLVIIFVNVVNNIL